MSNSNESFDLHELYQLANSRLAEISPNLPDSEISIPYNDGVYNIFFIKNGSDMWNITGNEKVH